MLLCRRYLLRKVREPLVREANLFNYVFADCSAGEDLPSLPQRQLYFFHCTEEKIVPLRKCSYSISFLPRWGWFGQDCSLPDPLIISDGWHFTDTWEVTKQDLTVVLSFIPCLICPTSQLQLSLSLGPDHLAHCRAPLLIPPVDISPGFETILWLSQLRYSA